MPSKAKSSKKERAPAARKKAAQKKPPIKKADLFAKQIQKLNSRLTELEKSARIQGPAGAPGPPGPKGDPADPARLNALEQRIRELEARLTAPQQTNPI